MTGFKKGGRGGARVRLAAEETAVVRSLMEQLLQLVGHGADADELGIGISGNTTAPDDPVLARLFPDAYREDAESAGEFRRYTEEGLREGKRAAARVVIETLDGDGEITLDAEQSQAWLRALNDVRLALGTRLEITEESYGRLSDLDWDDPRYPLFATYDWLTFLQESLVRALS